MITDPTYGNADGVYSGTLEFVHVVLSEPRGPWDATRMSQNAMSEHPKYDRTSVPRICCLRRLDKPRRGHYAE